MARPPRLLLLIVATAVAMGVACGGKSPSEPTAPSPSSPSAPAAVAPSITTQPSSLTINAGETAALAVVASGDGPLAYQWYAGASGTTTSPVDGATGASFTTPALSATESYWVRVSNVAGAINSSAATVTVTQPPPPPPAPPTPAPPSGPGPSVLAFEDNVLTLVNQYRASGATCGGSAYPAVPALAMQSQLRAAARAHSQDMAAQGYFSHTSLDGRTFSQRIRNAGYMANPIGENIAAGYSTPQAVVAGWMASSGHCANIMSAGYRSIGVGYAYLSSSPYGHYWTQDFGGQ